MKHILIMANLNNYLPFLCPAILFISICMGYPSPIFYFCEIITLFSVKSLSIIQICRSYVNVLNHGNTLAKFQKSKFSERWKYSINARLLNNNTLVIVANISVNEHILPLYSLKVDLPILPCVFFTLIWLTLTSEMHFVRFHTPEVKEVCTPRNEVMMKYIIFLLVYL